MNELKITELYIDRCKKDPEFKEELLGSIEDMQRALNKLRVMVQEAEA